MQPIMWFYHLPHIIMAITSATLLNNKTHQFQCGFTINHTNMAITSAIVRAITFATVYMEITSAMALHIP